MELCRQCDPLSTLLLNLVLEVTIRNSKLKTNGTTFNKEHQFADDLTNSKIEKKAGKNYEKVIEEGKT